MAAEAEEAFFRVDRDSPPFFGISFRGVGGPENAPRKMAPRRFSTSSSLSGDLTMPTVKFVGRVIPELPEGGAIHPPAISIRNTKNNLSVTFEVHVEKSEVIVIGECNRFEPGDLGILVTRATDLVNSAVDLISFYVGAGFRVVLEKVTAPDGRETRLLPVQPQLRGLCTAYSLDENDQNDFDLALSKVATTPELFLALNDLISGLISTHQSAIAFARSLETLRVMVSKDEQDRNKQWARLQTVLNVTEAYLTPITAISTSPRHGARTGPLKGDPVDVAKRMWVVMNRALEYEMRGRNPLSRSEFPVL